MTKCPVSGPEGRGQDTWSLRKEEVNRKGFVRQDSYVTEVGTIFREFSKGK